MSRRERISRVALKSIEGKDRRKKTTDCSSSLFLISIYFLLFLYFEQMKEETKSFLVAVKSKLLSSFCPLKMSKIHLVFMSVQPSKV